MVLGMTVEFPIPCFPMPTNKNCRGISTGLMILLIEGSTAFFHSNAAFGDSTVNTLEDPAVCQKLNVSSMEPMFDLALLSNWGLWLQFTADPKFSLLDEGLLVQNVTCRFSGAFTRPGSTS
jgi:hypothetical protein